MVGIMESELEELKRRIDVLDTRIAAEQRTIHTMMIEMTGLWEALAVLQKDMREKRAIERRRHK
jgi:uncharacterized coiled-coil protein SlyX